MTKLNALIAGSTGYIGIQLVKCLIKHKNIKIKYLCGNSSVGKKLSYYEKLSTFKKLPKIIKFDNKLLKDVDLVFTALPNGEAQKISKHLLDKNTLIDLAADFRLEDPKEFKKWYKIKHKVPKKFLIVFTQFQKFLEIKLKNLISLHVPVVILHQYSCH